MRRVLLIAFHFPPIAVSSGVQRTLKFVRYLPEYGWEPMVLTISPRAYQATRDDQLAEIDPAMPLVRAFGLDSIRHLGIGGRYVSATALPDRWVTWWAGAVPAGLGMIRRHRPAVLWSTFPIATSHLIGLTLRRLSGLPWIADFRDSMTEPGYPEDPRQWRAYRWIERRTVEGATRSVFTTPGAVRMYAERYPRVEPSRWRRIPNGYDEENFERAAAQPAPSATADAPLTLVHSGILYPMERDPDAFFGALSDLQRAARIGPRRLRVVLRATGSDDHHRALIARHGVGDIVSLVPGVPYEAALREMLSADGLLLFQAANCNHQIPAKVYEYLRARRPILALTDQRGDTAALLREAGIDTIVPLDDRAAIARGLEAFLARIDAGTAPVASDDEIARHSRRARTASLAALLDEVADEGRRSSPVHGPARSDLRRAPPSAEDGRGRPSGSP